jgi:hypothetical protein
MSLSTAELILDRAGVCRQVILDGVEVANVSHADIEMIPGQITALNLTVLVDSISTSYRKEES